MKLGEFIKTFVQHNSLVRLLHKFGTDYITSTR